MGAAEAAEVQFLTYWAHTGPLDGTFFRVDHAPVPAACISRIVVEHVADGSLFPHVATIVRTLWIAFTLQGASAPQLSNPQWNTA